MKRYPDGWQGKNFFQKDAPSHMPEWIPTRAVPGLDARRREADHRLRARRTTSSRCSGWSNMGCIDMHTWASRVDKPDRPDWVMFDLDPSEGVGFEEVDRGRAARQARRSTCSARELPEDVAARAGSTCSSRSRGATRSRRRASSRGSSPARSLERTPASSTTEWTKAEAPRRPRRREPERAGQDDRVGLLGAPAAGRPGLDAAALGRGRTRGSTRSRSRWTPCSTASHGRRPLRRRARAAGSRSKAALKSLR